MAALEAYAALKLLALKWATGRLTPEERAALARMGFETLRDLDRRIHELHKQAAAEAVELGYEDVEAEGDALVLAGLLSLLGHRVLAASGDGWREPARLMLEHATVEVKFESPVKAVVYADVDSPIDEADYVMRYVEEYGERLEDARRLVAVDGDRIVLAVPPPPRLEEYGAGRVERTPEGVWAAEASGVDPEELAEIAAELLAAYTILEEYAPGEVPGPDYRTRSEEEIERYLRLLSRRAPFRVSGVGVWLEAPHSHSESYEIHVHVAVKAEVAVGHPAELIPAVAALIASLDANFEEREHAAEAAAEEAIESYRTLAGGSRLESRKQGEPVPGP